MCGGRGGGGKGIALVIRSKAKISLSLQGSGRYRYERVGRVDCKGGRTRYRMAPDISFPEGGRLTNGARFMSGILEAW